MKFTGTMKNLNGELHIGGVSVSFLKEKYQTPLYIYDLELIENRITQILNSFKSEKFNTTIVYASKAYLSKGISQVMKKFGVHMDAVSAGELFTINSSGFPMKNVHMHGNNKSKDELTMCLDYNIGSVIIDSFSEAKVLSDLCKMKNKKIDVMVRLNIGIEAHTHEYIKTAKHSSKFGISIFNNDASDLLEFIVNDSNINFLGFHCHIGSQILDEKSFFEAVDVMTTFTKEMSEKFSIKIPEINLGGGFGIRYTEEDSEINLPNFLEKIIKSLEENLEKKNLEIENVIIEPGRVIVAQAGTTLYTIGGTKETFSEDKFIFVDGGMTDNIRPALYQAKYEACIANRLNESYLETVCVAGKCCESGDVIIKSIELTKATVGDLLAVSCTGAYGYSMSSSYNMALKPAVVFVKDGNDYLITKREGLMNLVKDDLNLIY